ncbi:hypothetical protein GCM10023162_04910 [Klenkia terrae]
MGLSGEVRRVGGIGRRLAEAARQGYTLAVVPPDPGPVPREQRVVEIPAVGSVLNRLF